MYMNSVMLKCHSLSLYHRICWFTISTIKKMVSSMDKKYGTITKLKLLAENNDKSVKNNPFKGLGKYPELTKKLKEEIKWRTEKRLPRTKGILKGL